VKLVRDVMDKKILDLKGCPIGRVDGLAMQVGDHSPPRITHIKIGGPTSWSRLHPVFARLSNRLAQTWGPKRTGPVRIPWSRVVTVGKDIKLDVDGRRTGAIDWEIWVARHVIEHIPGSGQEEAE
jgi:sporulation protein YlmC with PRC-barrel domain